MSPAELAAAGFGVNEAVWTRLARFVELLDAENRRVNLTSLRDPRDIWAVHVCDSLAFVPIIRAAGARRVVDLGTGGGLPGVPLACVLDDVHFTLVDSIRKKVEATARIVAALGLTNVALRCGRAESLAHEPELRERFDGLTARAVAPLRILVELACGFVRPPEAPTDTPASSPLAPRAAAEGRCWFAKSGRVAKEIADAARAADACQLRLIAQHVYHLPAGHGARVILEYAKLAPVAPRLPRAAGVPAKRPL